MDRPLDKLDKFALGCIIVAILVYIYSAYRILQIIGEM